MSTPTFDRGRVPDGPFDPAAWLARADEYNVDVYVWTARLDENGEPEHRFFYDIANERTGDIDIWRWLRPDEETARANERVLHDHIDATHRFGPRRLRERIDRMDCAVVRENLEAEQVAKLRASAL